MLGKNSTGPQTELSEPDGTSRDIDVGNIEALRDDVFVRCGELVGLQVSVKMSNKVAGSFLYHCPYLLRYNLNFSLYHIDRCNNNPNPSGTYGYGEKESLS